MVLSSFTNRLFLTFAVIFALSTEIYPADAQAMNPPAGPQTRAAALSTQQETSTPDVLRQRALFRAVSRVRLLFDDTAVAIPDNIDAGDSQGTGEDVRQLLSLLNWKIVSPGDPDYDATVTVHMTRSISPQRSPFFIESPCSFCGKNWCYVPMGYGMAIGGSPFGLNDVVVEGTVSLELKGLPAHSRSFHISHSAGATCQQDTVGAGGSPGTRYLYGPSFDTAIWTVEGYRNPEPGMIAVLLDLMFDVGGVETANRLIKFDKHHYFARGWRSPSESRLHHRVYDETANYLLRMAAEKGKASAIIEAGKLSAYWRTLITSGINAGCTPQTFSIACR
jgi:hypothetical protein